MKSDIRSSIVLSRGNSIHLQNEGNLLRPQNGSSEQIMFDSPFIQVGADINQSTTPLNSHQENDKHSFTKETPLVNSGNIMELSNKDGSEELEQKSHLRGAEQRKKMFNGYKSQELSDHYQLKSQPTQQQPKNDDDYADEVNSPSLTSNSQIFQKSDEMRSQKLKTQTGMAKRLATEDTSNGGGGNGIRTKQVSRQSQMMMQLKQVTTDVSTSKQESISFLDRMSQNAPILQMYAKQTSAKQASLKQVPQVGESQKISPNRAIEEVSMPQSLNNSGTQLNQQMGSFPLFQGLSSVVGVGGTGGTIGMTSGGMPMNFSIEDRIQSGYSSNMSAQLFNNTINNKDSSNTNNNGANETDLYPREKVTGFSLDQQLVTLQKNPALDNQTPQNQTSQALRSLASSSIAGGQTGNNLVPNNIDQSKGLLNSIENTRRGSHYLEIPQANNNNINAATYTSNPSQHGRRNSGQSQMSQHTQAKDRPKKRNFLKAFYYTYKFLSKMRFVRKYKNIYMLEKKHFKLIKDYSFGGLYERARERSMFLKLFGNLYYFIFDIKSPFRTFQPNSLLLLLFEFTLFLILIFLLFYIPIKVCFSQLSDYSEPAALSSFLSSIPYVLLLEVFVSANTAYFSQGATVNDRKLIIKKYLGMKFWIDIITIISLTQSSIVPLLFILRISQIFKILNDFDEYFQIQFRFPTYFELFKLLIIIIFMAHICACGFRLILEYQTVPKTWVTEAYLTNRTWVEIYVASLYFSFTTMITVGFGDIVPYSLLERVYVIIIQLVSCGVFAYAINTIGSIFQEIAKKSAEYRQQKQEIIDYMTRRDISKSTSIKILKYLEYYHSSGENGHQKGYSVLNILSKRLKDVVYKEYYGGLLLQFKLLSRQFSEKFLRTLSLYMKETTLSPGEILYNQGELDQRIFYVQTGEIEQYIDLQDNGHKDIILGTYKEGDYFGQYGFLGNQECKSSARSVNVSQMVYCTIEDFVAVIRQFPNDYETYCQLKDGVQFNQDKIDIVCTSCGRYSHIVQDCPLLHYEIDKEAHIRRWVHSDPQKRDETFTRKKPFFHIKSSEDRNVGKKRPSSMSPPKNERKMNYRHQRFNVFREMGDLKTNLRFLRLKLGSDYDEQKMQLGEEEEQLMKELSDFDFIMKTRVPLYQTLQLRKQRQQMRRDLGEFDDNIDLEDEEDPYEEEFAGYEDIMDNEDSNQNNNSHNLYGVQRMSTLSSQVHVPTEKSLFIRMPSTNSFHPSGRNEMVQENTSEDKEEDDDDDDDEQDAKDGKDSDRNVEKRSKALSDDATNQENERSLPIYGKHQSSSRKSSALSGQGSSQQMHQVSFKEEMLNNNQPRKVSTPRQSKIEAIINNTSIYEEEVNSPKYKSRFFRGPENIQSSPQRFQNRHQTVTVASSFNNISHNFETYLRSSNLDNPTSMNSIVLQNQNSKRKGTVLSSIGQNSSKLRNQGSMDASMNNYQRTGTLNSRGIIRNSNRNITKKLSDQKSYSKQTTILSKSDTKKDSHTKMGQSGTQYAKFANTRIDIASDKKIPNLGGNSSKTEIATLFVVMDFEKFCEFTHYFPEHNLSNVLKLLKKDQKRQEQLYQATSKVLKSYKTGRTAKFANSLLASQSKRNPTEVFSSHNRPSNPMNNTINLQLAMSSQQGLTNIQDDLNHTVVEKGADPTLHESLSQFARKDPKKIVVSYND